MFIKAFLSYLFLLALCSKSTNCFKSRAKKNEASSGFLNKPIVLTATGLGNRHIEIRIVSDRMKINRLKDHVKKLQKSSESNAKEVLALKKMNKTVNPLKVQNFSAGYEQLIKNLQNQVNRLMMTSILFPRNGTNNYVLLRNVITKDLVSVTVCFWMKTADTTNSGTPFSYSKGTSGEELLIFNYKKFEFWIHGERRQASFSANDGIWHHICGTWQSTDGSWALYKDGTVKAQGKGFKTGSKIRGGGVLVLGQEQDQEGGKFEAHQAFVGRMTSVDVWSRVLPSQEIHRMSGSCGLGYGDVMRWSDVRGRNRHNVGLEYLPKCT